MFGRREYDRTRILAEAIRAKERGKTRKAIEHYLRILEVEPDNTDLHRSVAPLFARAKKHDEAWHSYQRAIDGSIRLNDLERAHGLYADAAAAMPWNVEVWLGLADLESSRGSREAALAAIHEGLGHFTGRRDASRAARLLESACALDPDDVDRKIELAALLPRAGRRKEARALLREIGESASGGTLRRVRALELRHWPSFRTAASWLGAVRDRAA